MTKRKKISEVFTPRQSTVNSSMYVPRPVHEKVLSRALKRDTHILIFGDSGNGKSWLYKRVLEDLSVPFLVANCANASRLGSLTQEIVDTLVSPGTVKRMGFSEKKAGEIRALIAKGGVENSSDYQIKQSEKLLEAFSFFSNEVSGRKIIVLDNLEMIYRSEELMRELADIIILLDDERYSVHKVCLMIVGVPNGVLDYFSKTKNLSSVANRIIEIEKVASLDRKQVEEIINRGFNQLAIFMDRKMKRELIEHVSEITLGVAQRVHEYCECLAYEVEDNDWRYKPELLEVADIEWLKQGMRQSYHVVESHLNSKQTSIARRNQVIYCISKVTSHQFNSKDIDRLIKEEFPSTVPDTNMGIGAIMTELCNGDKPLISKGQNNTYSVIDPRYLMCVRIILYKDRLSKKVLKKNFKIN